MEKLIIQGRTRLHGEVTISGAKNAAVAILPATLLINGICTIENLPNISDVQIQCEILRDLGATVEWIAPNTARIDTSNLKSYKASLEKTSKFRASYYLIGALLGRCNNVEVGLPGGCNLGARPIDQHIKGFEALGAKVDVATGKVSASAQKLIGAPIYMDTVSVGATINIMLAAVLAEGTTVIDNAAKEPHIVDVANFLNSLGADIRGAGTDIIKINGVKSLRSGSSYSVVPDQIEAGTFMAAVVGTRGKAIIKNVYPAHLTFFNDKLIKMGASIKLADPTTIEVSCRNRLNSINFVTQPYPGFPTDLQAIAMTLLTTSNGVGIITESLYENRFMQVPDLRRMGADIHQDRNHAIIKGVKNLTGATVVASDLRAGAALVVAGLMANGETYVEKLHHIDRGYEAFEYKLSQLGAKIKRFDDAEIISDKSGTAFNMKGVLNESRI